MRVRFISVVNIYSLLSIQAVFAGSDAHLAKASSSLIGGWSSVKTLEKKGSENHEIILFTTDCFYTSLLM